MAERTQSHPPIPENAFDPGFLACLHERDDPPDALAAECGGAWNLLPWDGSTSGVFRPWEDADRDLPRASFLDEAAAHLAVAVLPGLGSEPTFAFEGGPDDLGRFAIRRRGEHCGQMMLFDETWLMAMNVAAGLARSPAALAHLLEAAGPTAVELAGRCLSRSVERAPSKGTVGVEQSRREAGFRPEP